MSLCSVTHVFTDAEESWARTIKWRIEYEVLGRVKLAILMYERCCEMLGGAKPRRVHASNTMLHDVSFRSRRIRRANLLLTWKEY
jgi:hypothetical protein